MKKILSQLSIVSLFPTVFGHEDHIFNPHTHGSDPTIIGIAAFVIISISVASYAFLTISKKGAAHV